MGRRNECDPETWASLSSEARRLTQQLVEAEAAAAAARERRTVLIKEMHVAGVPWAEIGRQLGMSGPAAMYAAGYATRTQRKRGEWHEIEPSPGE